MKAKKKQRQRKEIKKLFRFLELRANVYFKKIKKKRLGYYMAIIELDPKRNKREGKHQLEDSLAHEGNHGLDPLAKEKIIKKRTKRMMKNMTKKDRKRLRRFIKEEIKRK